MEELQSLDVTQQIILIRNLEEESLKKITITNFRHCEEQKQLSQMGKG
jgi:hypothetical protein